MSIFCETPPPPPYFIVLASSVKIVEAKALSFTEFLLEKLLKIKCLDVLFESIVCYLGALTLLQLDCNATSLLLLFIKVKVLVYSGVIQMNQTYEIK